MPSSRRIAIGLTSGNFIALEKTDEVIADDRRVEAGDLPELWINGDFLWLIVRQEMEISKKSEVPGVRGNEEEEIFRMLIPENQIESMSLEEMDGSGSELLGG